MPTSPPPAPLTYPFDYLDKGCLAASSAEHGVSNAPTWEFTVTGRLDPEALRRGLTRATARYPSCRARAVPRGGDSARARACDWVVGEPFDVDTLLEVVSLAPDDAAGLDAIRRRVRDRFLDAEVGPALHVTLVQRGAAGAQLLIQQHHGLADGGAFIAFLQDLARAIDAPADAPLEVPAEEVVHRLPETAPLALSPWRRRWYVLAGLGVLLRLILRGIALPLRPLFHNRSLDYQGANRTEHLALPDTVLAEWKARAGAAGASLNSALTVAYFRAMGRWSAELGVPPGRTNATLAASTQRRDAPVRSFANHLAGFIATLRLDRPDGVRRQLAQVHDQVSRQARRHHHLKRLLFERWAAARMPLGKMRQLIFAAPRPAFCLNFSNLVPLPFATLRGEGWAAPTLRVTTPCIPRTGVVLTVIRYGGEVCFNVNYKESVVSQAQAQRLVAHLDGALTEVFEALASGTA